MPVTLDQFIDNLLESGLLTDGEVKALRESLPPERPCDSPQDLARELIKAGKLTKFQAQRIYQGKTKGLVLGEYVILDRIGAGGMGEVYKARHRIMDRVVALKILPAKALKSPDAVNRFQREVRAAAKLEHPNVVTAHDAGHHENIHYLVMECVDGQDLSMLIREHGPLPVEEVIECIVQAARGLEYAHMQGVVHRDIKPGNLLLAREGTVKILDMGLARMGVDMGRTEGERLTESGAVLGTCDYMAPEQAEDTHGADHRADIYSLGCTLYRLLTGEAPYKGETLIQILLAHREAPIPSLCTARDIVPRQLDAVFQKMVAKRPEDRQQSMGELIADLEACRKGEEPVARTKPALEEPSTDSALRSFLQSLPATGVATRPKAKAVHQETIAGQVEQERAATAAEQRVPATGRKKLLVVGIAGGAVGLVALVVLGLAVLGRGRSEPEQPPAAAEADQRRSQEGQKRKAEEGKESEVIIVWPKAERADATLQVDSRKRELSKLIDPSNPDQLKVPLAAGEYTIWIARRGFEPFERTVVLRERQAITVEPVWRELTGPMTAADDSSPLELTERGHLAVAESAPPETEASPQPEEPAPQQPAEAVAEETPTEEAPPAPTEVDPALKRQRELEAKYTAAMAPVEERVGAWDFSGAAEALKQVRFEEEELAARLAVRREELRRMTGLKSRIIAKVNAADPPPKKFDLMLRGQNGDVTGADEEEGIRAKLPSGKAETRAWHELGRKATSKLLELGIDPASANDWLAGGLLAFATDDTSLAEKLFEQARSKGADIAPYLASLAAGSFARATELLEQQKFKEADHKLTQLGQKYATLSWFTANKAAFDVARQAAKAGIHEAEAEKLYTEAAGLFEKEQFFDVRPIVKKLKTDYANTAPTMDSGRKPSFAEMDEAIAELGQFITVRLDGEGDFTGIQAAIDEATPNSLIEIHDNGPYFERIMVPKGKEGLTLRGAKDCWPVVRSGGPLGVVSVLVTVDAPRTTVERLIIAKTDAEGDCLRISGSCRLRYLIFGGGRYNTIGPHSEIEGCFWASEAQCEAPVVVSNSIGASVLAIRGAGKGQLENVVLRGRDLTGATLELRCCTVDTRLMLYGGNTTIVDSILDSVQSDKPGDRIESCDIFSGSFIDFAKPGKNCFSADPQFVNRELYDHRLMPTSPCRGKASDGGDLGVRYTPEMVEILKVALALRQQNLIKFGRDS